MSEARMRNILVSLRFDGTAYHGWQVQTNAVTVQQTVQDTLEKVLKYRPPIVGCSRTDSGVHANEYFFNFNTGASIPCERLRRALNSNFPYDISAVSCREVPPEFHARYSAVGKEYIYRIWNSDSRDPFLNAYSFFCPRRLDPDLMRRAGRDFIGTHDFSAFCSSGSGVEDTVRTVSLLETERSGNLVTIRIRADGFLYNMVRIIAGTLVAVSQKRVAPDGIPAIIAGGRRVPAGQTLPACGLFLNRVFYDSALYGDAALSNNT